MIGKTKNRYQVSNPAALMEQIHEKGNAVLQDLRNLITEPETRRSPRTWTIAEATPLVDVSITTIRKLLETHPNMPGLLEDSATNKKKLTLEAINFLRDYTGNRYKRPSGSKCLTIAISNLKGGVGKTQTAVDLAKKIAIEGMRVLLLDFDAQGTATLISSGLIPDWDVSYDQTITNCLLNDLNLIHEIIIPTHFSGLDIIPANLAIQECDLGLPNQADINFEKLGAPIGRLQVALDKVKDNYDVILIDCGPNLGALTLSAMVASNGMLIPIPPGMNDYASFVMYSGALCELFSHMADKKFEYLRILLSKHTGSNAAKEMENMMRQQLGSYVLTNNMCETVEVAKASSELGSIYDVVKPQGNKDAYRRAMQHLDDVNMEIINNFKEIWQEQAQNTHKEEDNDICKMKQEISVERVL